MVTHEPARLGIIGVGDVAQRDYLPEIGRLAPEAIVVAVAGAREQRARETAERLGIEAWHVGYRSLLADGAVDAVVDLTPPQLHEEVNMAAIDAGKHVYSEKPLALTAGAARSLGRAAAGRGLVLSAAPSVVVFPQIRRVSDELASGRLGTAVIASGAVFGGVPPWEGFASDPTPYFVEDVGPLVDIGVYPLHALTALLGPILRVAAMSRRTRDRFDLPEGPARGATIPVLSDDVWTLVAELDDGVIASVHANFATAFGTEPELEILCDKGGVACSLLDSSLPVRVDHGQGWSEVAVPVERPSGPDHILGVRHFVRCIRGDERPLLTADHSAHVLDVIEAARRSGTEARTVVVPGHGWSPAGGKGT